MKILIWVMARALGDGIIYTGYVREIKKIYPDAQLDIFCTKMHAAAFKNNPYVDNFYYFNTYNKPFSKITRTKIYLNPLMHIKNLIKARKQKYDIVIDVDSSYKRSNLFMVKFIMGKNYKKENRVLAGRFKESNKYGYTKEKLLKIYTHLYSPSEGSAYTYLFKDNKIDDKYELFIDEKSLKKADEYYKNTALNNKKIIFNGEGSDKSISSKKIIDTLNALLNAYPEYYIYIIGYDDYYDKYDEIVKKINNKRLQITYKTNIQDTFALIKYADLLISVDTALIHIASAVGTNVCEIISYGKKGNFIGKPRFVDFIICENKANNHFDLDGFEIDEVITATNKLI